MGRNWPAFLRIQRVSGSRFGVSTIRMGASIGQYDKSIWPIHGSNFRPDQPEAEQQATPIQKQTLDYEICTWFSDILSTGTPRRMKWSEGASTYFSPYGHYLLISWDSCLEGNLNSDIRVWTEPDLDKTSYPRWKCVDIVGPPEFALEAAKILVNLVPGRP
ncbi:hypothetical protein N656DRAFT_79949 [Canariomyces notabilis]|uniref:Uncharacterized protein n=1 Tax=Canariomyces notabilis TaxID=2074819 RepID=A0AAN6TEU0_9PEZI|nr:hypothetical protein N656DRAFT_79949 [Canariomyces arenarius]